MADWKSDLSKHFRQAEQKQAGQKDTDTSNADKTKKFMTEVVVPAFQEVKTELAKHGRVADVYNTGESASIRVVLASSKTHSVQDDFTLYIKVRNGVYPYPECLSGQLGKRYRTEGFLRSGAQNYTIEQVTKEEIIQYVISEIKNRSSH